MKLYKILERHCAPKDQTEFVRKYVLADDEQTILEMIDKDNFGQWAEESADREVAGENLIIYDADYNEVGTETFLECMLRVRGEFNWDDAPYEDAHDGVTHVGWDEGTEIDLVQATVLIQLGIAEDWREKCTGSPSA